MPNQKLIGKMWRWHAKVTSTSDRTNVPGGRALGEIRQGRWQHHRFGPGPSRFHEKREPDQAEQAMRALAAVRWEDGFPSFLVRSESDIPTFSAELPLYAPRTLARRATGI